MGAERIWSCPEIAICSGDRGARLLGARLHLYLAGGLVGGRGPYPGLGDVRRKRGGDLGDRRGRGRAARTVTGGPSLAGSCSESVYTAEPAKSLGFSLMPTRSMAAWKAVLTRAPAPEFGPT